MIFILILVKYFDALLERRKMYWIIRSLIWTIYYIVQFYVIRTDFSPTTNLLLNIAGILGIISLLYHGRLVKKIVLTVLIVTIWMVNEIVVGFLLIALEFKGENLNLAGTFISKDVMLLIVYGINIYMRNKRISYIPVKFWIFLGLVPVMSIFIMHNLFLANQDEELILWGYTSISATMILGVNIILLSVFERLSNELQIQRENMCYSQQLNLYTKQIEEQENITKEIRKQRHDIRNKLLAVKAYLKKKDFISLEQYLDGILESHEEKVQISNSGNILIDTILNNKLAILEKRNMEIKVQMEIPNILPYDAGDLCVLLGNALDNAIEAIKKIKDERKYIGIFITYNKRNLLIVIRNTYTGKIEWEKEGSLKTSKKDLKEHGIGLLSIRKVSEKYNGLVDITCDKNIFELRVILYNLSFTNRTPFITFSE